MLAVGFPGIRIIKLRKFLSVPILLSTFIRNTCWILINSSVTVEVVVWFLYFSLLITLIDFSNLRLVFHSGINPAWSWVLPFFYVLLDSVCQPCVNFCICDNRGYWYWYSCNVCVWFCCQSNVGLKKWIGNIPSFTFSGRLCIELVLFLPKCLREFPREAILAFLVEGFSTTGFLSGYETVQFTHLLELTLLLRRLVCRSCHPVWFSLALFSSLGVQFESGLYLLCLYSAFLACGRGSISSASWSAKPSFRLPGMVAFSPQWVVFLPLACAAALTRCRHRGFWLVCWMLSVPVNILEFCSRLG